MAEIEDIGRTPLRNVGTSRVLYELTGGPKTPKDLSEALRVAPPGIMEQLHRLEGMGLVRRGEKSGKFQYYKLVEDQVVELFLDVIEGRVREMLEWEPEEVRKERMPRREEIERVRGKLAGNKYFRGVALGYLRAIASQAPRQKASKAIGDFTAIAWLSRWFVSGRGDKEKREFESAMKKFYKWLGEERIVTFDALMEAMRKAGLR